MGVAWNSCSKCGESFPDCGDFEICSEDKGGCGRVWCSYDCALEDGYIEEHCKLGKGVDYTSPTEDCEFANGNKYCKCEGCSNYVEESCSYCRNEAFEDSELLEYALQGLKMTKQELIECLKEDKNEGEVKI
jgi:hypothetical protein